MTVRPVLVADDREFVRLRAENLALKTRVLELEDALAQCMQRGVRLEEILRYRDDVPPSRKPLP